MKSILKCLLNRLDAVERDHEEVGDTDVREQMSVAIFHAFVAKTPDYGLPSEFGLFDPEGDAAVRAALAEFVEAAGRLPLTTPQDRFAAFQDGTVRSDAGRTVDHHFGHAADWESWSAAVSRPELPGPVGRPPWWQFWRRAGG